MVCWCTVGTQLQGSSFCRKWVRASAGEVAGAVHTRLYQRARRTTERRQLRVRFSFGDSDDTTGEERARELRGRLQRVEQSDAGSNA